MVLREWRDADAEPLAAAFREDPDLARVIGLDGDTTADGLRRLWADEPAMREKEEFLGLIVAHAGTGAAWGVVNFANVSRRVGRTDLGIWLTPGARGRGAALEAMRLLCGWAYRDAGFHRIQLVTLTGNGAMRRLAERAGFREEALLREYVYERGRGHDFVLYAQLRTEFA